MNKTSYEKLVKFLKRLKEQYANYTNKKDRSVLDEEGVKESVIKRFEVCYDTLWKHLKKISLKIRNYRKNQLVPFWNILLQR